MVERRAQLLTVVHLAFWTPALVAQVRDAEVRCDYSKRMACTESGCKAFPTGSAFLLIPSLERLNTFDPELDKMPEIRRCDDKGCTPVAVQPSPSGAFLNLSSAGYILKLTEVTEQEFGLGRGNFVEVSTTWLAALVSYGSCRLPRE